MIRRVGDVPDIFFETGIDIEKGAGAEDGNVRYDADGFLDCGFEVFFQPIRLITVKGRQNTSGRGGKRYRE